MDWELFSKEAKGDAVSSIEGPNLYKSLCLISLSLTLLFHIIVLSIYYIYSLNCHFSNRIYCEFYLGRIWSQSNSPILGLFIYTWANNWYQSLNAFCSSNNLKVILWVNIFVQVGENLNKAPRVDKFEFCQWKIKIRVLDRKSVV